MKVKLKTTGEIINVIDGSTIKINSFNRLGEPKEIKLRDIECFYNESGDLLFTGEDKQKEEKSHYFHYTYVNTEGNVGYYGWGVQSTRSSEFNFLGVYKDNPKHSILTVNEISKEQFDLLWNYIEDENKKK